MISSNGVPCDLDKTMLLEGCMSGRLAASGAAPGVAVPRE